MPDSLDGFCSLADPGRRAQGLGASTSQTIRYAAALHRGRLTIGNFDNEWGMRPAPFDAKAGFDQALTQDRLQAWLEELGRLTSATSN